MAAHWNAESRPIESMHWIINDTLSLGSFNVIHLTSVLILASRIFASIRCVFHQRHHHNFIFFVLRFEASCVFNFLLPEKKNNCLLNKLYSDWHHSLFATLIHIPFSTQAASIFRSFSRISSFFFFNSFGIVYSVLLFFFFFLSSSYFNPRHVLPSIRSTQSKFASKVFELQSRALRCSLQLLLIF